MNNDRVYIYVISDSIGETAEQVAKAASAQFYQCAITIKKVSYVTEVESMQEIIEEARKLKSIIFFTLVVPELKHYLQEQAARFNLECVDIMGPAVNALSALCMTEPTYTPGVMRKLDEEYFSKVEAIEFAVRYDDCKDPRGIKKADFVLVGVSRTSKTPLSMYLATKNIKVTNIPLLPEVKPPKELFEVDPKRVIGLVTSPDKLNAIRLERIKAHGLKSGDNYASMERIAYELKYAEEIMSAIGCRIIDVTDKAIEETASIILNYIKEVHTL